jgi:hypothetical protein
MKTISSAFYIVSDQEISTQNGVDSDHIVFTQWRVRLGWGYSRRICPLDCGSSVNLLPQRFPLSQRVLSFLLSFDLTEQNSCKMRETAGQHEPSRQDGIERVIDDQL